MDILSISCITWNVETSWPEKELLSALNLEEKSKDDSSNQSPDIILICLQEVRSQPQNVIMDTLFEEPWTTAFREAVGPHEYVRVGGERLQGIVTSVFVLRQHLPHLRDIHTAVTRTGLGGFWGNKGAVSVRFSLYGCSLCVVNSHLAAHDGGFEERCANYNTIIDETSFPINLTQNILYHDYVFWLGDLNFRLSGNDTADVIAKKVAAEDMTWLLQRDELQKAQKIQGAFGPLTEGIITFPPTYKYLRNSTDYDLSRRPAWTDRILHQVHVDAYEGVKLGLEQTLYDSKLEYGQSDHKPVVAKYSIKVFAGHTERCVTFTPIKEWLIGATNKVKYTLGEDVFTNPWDYITMFKANFTSVHQYVTYAYVPQSLQPNTDETSSTLKQNPTMPRNRVFELTFTDELVQSPGMYVLLYYSAKYNSYLGMSDPFPVTEKDE